jgi:ubiquinone/menaquinone biosynthesis C-methylase UbiE
MAPRYDGAMSPRGPHRLFFDLWSLVYDAPGVQRLTYRPVQDAVVRALRTDPPARILDVGCGTGRLALRLSRELPGSRVTGCDFSRGMLRQAQARAGALSLAQGDAQRLPFADGSFDAVVSTEAFHWFPDPEAALEGFHRVLAARGRLLIAFVNPSFEGLSRASRAVSRWLGEPLRWPTAAVLRRQVEAAGFEVASQRRIFRLPAPVLFPPVLTEAVRRV